MLFWVVTNRRTNWMRLKRPSGQVAVWGEGCTKSWWWVIPMSSPLRQPPLMRCKHKKLRILNTCVILFVWVCISFVSFDDMSHWWLITRNSVYHSLEYRVRVQVLCSQQKKINDEGWFFSVQFWPWPPFFRFPPPDIPAYTVIVRQRCENFARGNATMQGT